jgi:hypothetical protein
MGIRLRAAFALLCAAFTAWGVLLAQKPFKEYYGGEYNEFRSRRLPAENRMDARASAL